MATSSKYDQLSQRITDLLDGNLSPEQFAILQQQIETDPASLHYYIEYLTLWSMLSKHSQRQTLTPHQSSMPSSPSSRETILEILAEYEKHASPIPPPVSGSDSQHNQPSPRTVARSFTHRDLFRFLTKCAAIVVFALLFIWLDHQITNLSLQKNHIKVAQITNALNASWDYDGLQFNPGDWIWSDSYRLAAGHVELTFLQGARVIIEAPAEFQLTAPDSMRMRRGKVFATVPKEAIGFTIDTANSKVIDLGTEFGLLVDSAGNTDLHVLKGKTQLVASRVGNTQLIPAGQARRVDVATNAMTNIQLDAHAFARQIMRGSGLTWNGRDLSLADIVGGGNGLGSGSLNHGIDLFTGRKCQELTSIQTRHAPQRFLPTPEFTMIDSIFIPGYDNQNAQVSTTGLTCNQFPATSGNIWGYLFNGAWHEGVESPHHPLILDNVTLDAPAHPALAIHANLGVTFDLEKIRDSLPALNPSCFRARAGISQTVARHTTQDSRVEFWVLLDGKVMVRRLTRMIDGGFDINVPVTPAARFLSLAVSEADDGNGYDWAVFVNPRLELSTGD